MNILVTGAAGFIASHLIEELLKDKNSTIIGIDNFYRGSKESLELINSIDKNSQFKFFEADIRDFITLKKIIKEHNIEQIYHLAAIVSVQKSIQNPLLSHDVNVKGTLNILEAAKQSMVKRVLFSSSAAVYGDEPKQPKNETSKIKPISPYGYEKVIAEGYMKLYNDIYALECVVLRYFNVYGQRQHVTSDYSSVISIFEDKFKNNEIPTIYGNGEQYRDFIHVKDVVKVNIKAMNTPNIAGELFCVGTAQKTSVNHLFEIMNKKYNKEFKAQYLDARRGDILESVCDNKKVIQALKIDEFSRFENEVINL